VDPAVWCCSQQHYVTRGNVGNRSHQLMSLLLRDASIIRSRAVRLIDDHEFWTMEQELVPVTIALQEIDASDLNRIVLVNAVRSRFPAFELTNSAGANDHGIEVHLLRQFLLPLITEIGWAQYAHPSDFAAIEQFASNEQRFDRLPHAHVVRN